MNAIATPADVLSFWLGANPPTDEAALRIKAQWFTKSAAFDADLRERFLPTIDAALKGELDTWADTPEGWLALLIVLDQFTRNAFRGTPKAFAGDAAALRWAQTGLDKGWATPLPLTARIFTLLPLEHAEDAPVQAASVRGFAALVAQAATESAELRDFLDGTLNYAHQHADVIARFGRFPHRNAILGRANTPEETTYLAQPGSGF